jgi:hypothetical protein
MGGDREWPEHVAEAAPAVEEGSLDGDEAGRGPPGKKRPEPLRALHVVLDQVVANATEKVVLQAGDRGRPIDRRRPDQVRFSRSSGPAVQHLGRRCLERLPLLGVEVKTQLD